MAPSASPQPQGQIQPGSFTYTTTVGADGQTVYHLFRAVAASYQTPQGIVSGIQWVPAEATQVIPAGATPANADFMASFNRSQAPDGGAMRDWQRDEERRRRKEKDRRERDREEKELRRAREKDERAERERRRERKPSVGGYAPGYPPYEPDRRYSTAGGTADLERRFQDLEVERRDRDYDRDRAPRSRRGSFYGADRPAGYQPAPGGPQYPAPPGAYPTPATTAYTTTPPTGYANPAYGPGSQYPRTGAYPPSPRPGDAVAVPRPVSPYMGPGGLQRPVSPYHPGGGMQRPASPYQPGGLARPVSPYQTGPVPRPVSPYMPGGIQRSSSPRPGTYPPGHVMEGQPIRRALSRAGSPVPPISPYAPGPPNMYGGVTSSAYGQPVAGPYGGAGGYAQGGIPGSASPRMPLAPGEQQQQQMLTAPEGFSRPPNLAQPYTHFEMMKIQDMDDFLEVIPRMPLVLVPHDVYHEDWIRFMNDLAMSWSGRLPVPEYAQDGRPPKRTTLTADLVDLWNASFFMRRGVELVLYKGRERRSGRAIGTVDLHLPGFDTYDSISSASDSDSDDSDSSSDDSIDDRHRQPAYGGIYGRQAEGQMAELREARRVRRERKEEKKIRKREKKRRAKMREMERKYVLYLTCISPREGGLGPQM